MRKLLIVMQKSEVIYKVSKCEVWWKDLIRSQQQKWEPKMMGKWRPIKY